MIPIFHSGPVWFALTDAQETVVQVMMLGIGAGLGALVLMDYVAQRRMRRLGEANSAKQWRGLEYFKTFRTGLIVIIAYFEMLCAWLFFSNALSSSQKWSINPYGVMQSLQTAAFVVVSASLLVWLVVWLFKHVHLLRSQASEMEKEERLRLAMQSTKQGLYDLDLRTGISDTSPELAELLGYKPGEFNETHSHWIGRLHPEDRQRVLKIYDDYLSGRTPEYRVECRQRTAAGEWKWILSIGKIVERDNNNQPVRMLGTYTDITQQKLAEHRIEEQAEALRKLSAHIVELQDAERRRVARELHDTTAQHLAALAMNLSLIEQLAGEDSPKLTRALVDSQSLVELATQEIRTTAYLLHPPLLEASGLSGAIQDYAEGFSRRSGLKIGLVMPDNFERLPRDVELALFRVVQEGLANVRRHSKSSQAEIRLEKVGARVRLEVRDSGIGIPEEQLMRMRNQTGELGVGIAGMHERLQQLGGRLEIESSSGGTLVRAIWSENTLANSTQAKK
jgi:PAS domain S-box-containing protein